MSIRSLVRHVRRTFKTPVVSEKDAAFYDRMYTGSASYQTHYSESHYYFLWCVIADRLRSHNCRRVLEVGCGPGQLASLLFDLGLVDAYAGFDFSRQAVEMARRNVPQASWEVADARTADLHERFGHNAVICTEVLEHVADDFAVIERFRPGARCLCTVPNFPYESHVRHFTDAAEVNERYGRFFDCLSVAWFPSPKNRADRFFLMDGVKR